MSYGSHHVYPIDIDFLKYSLNREGWVPTPRRYSKEVANLLYAYNYSEPAILSYLADVPNGSSGWLGWKLGDSISSFVNPPKDLKETEKMIKDVEGFITFFRGKPEMYATSESSGGDNGDTGGGSHVRTNYYTVGPREEMDRVITVFSKRLEELKLIKELIGRGLYNWMTYVGVLPDYTPKYIPNYSPIRPEDYPILTGKPITHLSFIELYKELIENPYNAMPKWSSGYIFLTGPSNSGELSYRGKALSLSPNEAMVHQYNPLMGALATTNPDNDFGIFQITDPFDVSKFNKIPNPDEPNSEKYIAENRISIKLAVKSIEKSLLQLSRLRRINYQINYYVRNGTSFGFTYDSGAPINVVNGEAMVAINENTIIPTIDLSKYYYLQGDIVGHENAIRLINDLRKELSQVTSQHYQLSSGGYWYDKRGEAFRFHRGIDRAKFTNWYYLLGKVINRDRNAKPEMIRPH